MFNDDLVRMVIRARKVWDHAKGAVPACSNEAAAEAAQERMFVAYDSQGRAYDCFVSEEKKTGESYQQ